MKKILYRQIQSFKKKTFLSRKKNKCFRLCSHQEKKDQVQISFCQRRKHFSSRKKKWPSVPRDRLRSQRQLPSVKQKKKEKEKRERVSLTYSHTLTNSNPGQVRRRKKKKWPSEPRDRLRSRRQSKRNLDAVSPVFWMQKLPISKREKKQIIKK